MEFIPITEKTGYITTGYTALGLYTLHDGSSVLIDSGFDPPEKLERFLLESGIRPAAVINTHLHQDHCRNNNVCTERFGADVYCPVTDRSRREFRFAPSCGEKSVSPGEDVVIHGELFRTVSAPGHCDGHIFVITPDGVCCIGDAIMTEDRLSQSKLPYMVNVEQSLLTMEMLRSLSYEVYLASHYGVISYECMSEVIDKNIEKELYLCNLIRKTLNRSMPFEEAEDAALAAAGVRIPPHGAIDPVRISIHGRIMELASAGDFSIADGTVSPA